MSGARLLPRASRLLVAVAFAGSLMCAHPEAQQSGESFVRWAKAHAIQLQTVEINPAVPKNLFQEQKEKAPSAPGEAGDNACLSTDKLESQGLVQIGNLNKKALNKKQPKYPYEAKKHKLSGTVIVDVIVDLPSGTIEKAKIRKTNDFFKEEVIKVVCGVKFPPLTDIDIKPSQASGYLTYTFKSPK